MSNKNSSLSVLNVIHRLNAQSAGNDLILATPGAQLIDGLAGNDTVSYVNATTAVTASLIPKAKNAGAALGHTYRNIENLTGSRFADRLTGDDNANVLDGRAGADTLTGGKGDDTYVVDNRGDKTVELARAGMDTVNASITWTLGANLENLTLTGSAAINGKGNLLNNVITGNAGANTLDGADGNDTLDGGAGNDTMIGGRGNDIYLVNDAGDVVIEAARGGTDIIRASVTYTISANVENLTLTGTASISGTGNALANTITGNSGANTLDGDGGNDTLNGEGGNDTLNGGAGDDALNGGEGADRLSGDAGADILHGGAGSDELFGGAGQDYLDGGAGGDKMSGGAGDDTYIVTSKSDEVFEDENEGNDTVQASIDFILPANVDNLELMGDGDIHGTGNELDNIITGNEGNNIIDGSGGNDVLNGGAGDDVITLENGFAYGGTGDDTIDAEDGSGTLFGGQGNDTYDVLGNYMIMEEADGGIDAVKVYETFTMSAHLENGTLQALVATEKLTGNELNNQLTLTQEGILDGGAGDDTLTGGTGNNELEGGAGNDTVLFTNALEEYVFSWEAETSVLTASGDEGTDLIRNVETLVFAGEVYKGTFAGLAANSNKTLTGTGADDTLIGARGNDTIYGGAGNDTLDGRGGIDHMYGGAGDDVYFVDTGDDEIHEAGDGGTDTVNSSAAHYILGLDLENLTLTGVDSRGEGNEAANILTGNGSANVFHAYGGNDMIYGGGGEDHLFGGNHDDTLHGGAGGDVLHGDAGNDTLYGGEGVDLLYAGIGTDALYGGGDEGDTAVFQLNIAEYSFSWDEHSRTLTVTHGSGLAALQGFTACQFADRLISVDELISLT